MAFRIPEKDKKDYLYQCAKCGKKTWYIVQLPDHLLYCDDYYNLRTCKGHLDLVTTVERKH